MLKILIVPGETLDSVRGSMRQVDEADIVISVTGRILKSRCG